MNLTGFALRNQPLVLVSVFALAVYSVIALANFPSQEDPPITVRDAVVVTFVPGMKVEGCYAFRVTRNSDLWVDEEEVDDLMRALQGELPSRHYGDAVRLEVADTCTDEMAQYLLDLLGLEPDDLYRVNGPVNDRPFAFAR